MKTVLSFIVIATLFTSCTYYKPCSFQVANTYPNNTAFVGNVTATAKIYYPFNLGKIDERLPITQEAKNKLLSQHKLKPYQILTNITLDYKVTYWLFWFLGHTDRAIINADIIQILKPGEIYIQTDSLFMIGTKEVNGKKVNVYSQRLNYKWGEEVKLEGIMSSAEPKIIELYDDELLVVYYATNHATEAYEKTQTIVPYNKISKKQK